MSERDWEATARARLERTVADTVARIRATADQIEAEARRNIGSAAKTERQLGFHSYPRVAGQTISELQSLLFNINLANMIDAAADAETARAEKEAKR